MARTVYVTTSLTGGGSGLDGIDGNNILAGDMAFHINRDATTPKREGNYCGVYAATTDADSESAPDIIVPDSNAGSWNWHLLQPLKTIKVTTGKAATLDNYGVSVIRSTAPTVHQLKRPRRGARKIIIFQSTSLVKVRLTTAAAADLAAPTVRIGTSGSTMCVIAFTSRAAVIPNIARPQIHLVGASTRLWRVTNLLPWSTNKLKFSSST